MTAATPLLIAGRRTTLDLSFLLLEPLAAHQLPAVATRRSGDRRRVRHPHHAPHHHGFWHHWGGNLWQSPSRSVVSRLTGAPATEHRQLKPREISRPFTPVWQERSLLRAVRRLSVRKHDLRCGPSHCSATLTSCALEAMHFSTTRFRWAFSATSQSRRPCRPARNR